MATDHDTLSVRLVNCQKACKKCDDCRPCSRCVKYGIENNCVDSSRKERRKGVKRGPYRATPSTSRDLPDTEDSWTPDSERSVRTRRPVNYREAKDISDEEEEREEEEGTTYGNQGLSKSSTRLHPKLHKASASERHAALFKMVLSMMHGDMIVSADHPKLLDLAAICSEMYEMEFAQRQQRPPLDQRPQSKLDLSTSLNINYELDRAENNRTPGPIEFIKRDVPSPPGTPLALKIQPNQLSHSSNSPHQSSVAAPSAYYSPSTIPAIIATTTPHVLHSYAHYGSTF